MLLTFMTAVAAAWRLPFPSWSHGASTPLENHVSWVAFGDKRDMVLFWLLPR
jgi:hypothetical protein